MYSVQRDVNIASKLYSQCQCLNIPRITIKVFIFRVFIGHLHCCGRNDARREPVPLF